MGNKGKIGEKSRLASQLADQSHIEKEKKVYGRINNVFTDDKGKWVKPLIQVRIDEKRHGVPSDPSDSGLIGGPDTWIHLGNDPLDIALRFGEPKTGDRVVVVYKGEKPWLGTAYIIEEDKANAYGAAEVGQSIFTIFPPGG